MKNQTRNHYGTTALGLTLITLLVWAGTGVLTALAQPFNINTASRETVRVFYNTIYQASENVPINWTGSIAGCNPGAVSPAYLDATLLRVNYFRAMAGVPANITFTDSNNVMVQATALLMSANRSINHEPPATWTCYTQLARDGAAANLNIGSTGPKSIDSFIHDGGDNNARAGHRRSTLLPSQLTMASGHVPATGDFPSTATLWVHAPRAPQRPPVRDDFVAWPPKGFVPYQVVYPRWSFDLANADFAAATVTMQRNGADVPVRIDSREGWGEPGIVWIPNNLNNTANWPRSTADETYTVNINNVMMGGTPRNFTYTVTLIDPSVPGADYMPAVITGPDMPPLNQNSTYNFTAVPEATGYQWRLSKLTPLNLTDGAENGLANFDAMTSAYNPVDLTHKATGNAGFRLTMSAGFGVQSLTYKRTLLANANSQITFKSRYENIVSLAARVEVSTDDGATWTQAFNHTGTEVREGAFNDKVVPLGAFAGRQIKVRFNLVSLGGAVFTCCDPLGWYFDDLAFVNLHEVANPVVNNVAAGTSFIFNPTEQSEFDLSVRPQFFGQYFGAWGPPKRVSTITQAPATPPVLTAQPQNQVLTVGAEATFTVVATSAQTPTYQWKFNGTDLTDTADIQGSRTAMLTLRNVQAAQAGNYTVVVTNPSGNTTSDPGQLTVNPPPTLPVAVDVPPAVPVRTGGDENFFPELFDFGFGDGGAAAGLRLMAASQSSDTRRYARDGEDSARSGRIRHNQQSYLEIDETGPATLSFWWRVDSEAHFDFLEFQLDGTPLFRISGLVDWEERSVAIPAGQHHLRWVYRKDGSISRGADAGWVDLVELLDDTAPPTLADALKTTNTATVRWTSSGDLSWFTTLDYSHDDVDAAQSGPIGDNEESRLEATVVGPADLSFWWQVDAEVSDSLSFELDGITLFEKVSSLSGGDEEISFESDWEKKTVAIPAGTHRVSWVYRKDDSVSEGLDAGFVDEVTLTQRTPGQGNEPGPKIEYIASGQKLRLSWTEAATNYRLQSSPSLTTANWQDVPPNQIQRVNGEFSVTVSIASETRFYRLAP